ncbi:MAG TPA: MAPEG family protein [Alphaproteobacteria bacterium]
MRLFASPLYVGLAAILLIVLSVNVMRVRGRYKVGIGDGGHVELARAMRVQANFVEYVPIALLLLLCVDLVGDAKWIVHVLGILLLVGRVFHAYGLSRSSDETFGRAAGTVLTFLVLIVGAVLAILGTFQIRILAPA